MAKYKPQVLVHYASGLIIRNVVAVCCWVAFFVFIALTLHAFRVNVGQMEQLLSLGTMRYNPWIEKQNFENQESLFAFIGLLIGLWKTAKMRVEAQKILCMVEQEKHLKAIAARTDSRNV